MERARNISKSMLAYLKRARDHKEFLLRETQEFDRGKRHLANMMGIKSEEMTQTDIDDAIKYLFPSGLFDPRARPMMKHPDLIYKAQKEAQFDAEGRPHHYLFYTALPNYYEAISEISRHHQSLNEYEDRKLAEGILDPPPEAKFQLLGRTWLSHEQMCDKFIERLSDADYMYFIRCLEKLMNHPYSSRIQSFLQLYVKDKSIQTTTLDLPEIIEDEHTGEIYTEMTERKREHRVYVKTIFSGTGKIDIDGHDILFFEEPYHRTALLAPLRIAGLQDKVDIIARLTNKPALFYKPLIEGQSAIALAIRRALSLSIAAKGDKDVQEQLRLAGLLEPDLRLRERKKFGQMKARRKYTWKKR